MSAILFHTSAANFVQQAARSLFEAGQLERFITTVRNDPGRLYQRTVCAVGRLFGRDLAAQFRRRTISEIPLEKVETHPWGELFRLASGALDRSGRLTDLVWESSETGFDRMVARHLPRHLTAVYGYEFCSLATFRRARTLGIRTIYDLPAPESGFVQGLLEEEMRKFPELRTAYHRHTNAREERRTARRRAEWHAADLILVNSRFTRDSYARAGLDCARVRVANLGAPPPVTRDEALLPRDHSAPLSLLWAGTFGLRKGAHYLMEAWRSGNFGRHARLRIFGTIALPDRIMRPLPDGIEIGGAIPREQLLDEYRRADALILPTLCDGFGLVITEAWARGVPVITTNRAGAADLLRTGANGRLVAAGSSAAIVEEIAWCLEHRLELHTMRVAALRTAEEWQWTDYRRLHASTLRDARMFGPA